MQTAEYQDRYEEEQPISATSGTNNSAKYCSLIGFNAKLPNYQKVRTTRKKDNSTTSVTGTVESNVFQRTVDYPGELSEGFHVMLDSGELVTVRWDQVAEVRRVSA